MRIEGRLGPNAGELRAGTARAGASVGPSADLRLSTEGAAREDRLELALPPPGTLTLHGVELPFDPLQDGQLDLLGRWKEARVDAAVREALAREARDRAEQRRELAEAAEAASQGSPEVGAVPAEARPAKDDGEEPERVEKGEREARARTFSLPSEREPSTGLALDLSA